MEREEEEEDGNGSLGVASGGCKSEMLKRAYFIALIMNEDFPLSPSKTTTNTGIRHLNCDAEGGPRSARCPRDEKGDEETVEKGDEESNRRRLLTNSGQRR